MEELIVEGYLFQSKEDAALARGDAQKIELLQNRLDYSKPEEVLNVYRKAIEQHIFTTPVGMDFLKEMRGRLEEMEGITGGHGSSERIGAASQSRKRINLFHTKDTNP